jgi:uncharacterized membrane protein YfcA
MSHLLDFLMPPNVEPTAALVMLAASTAASFITIAFGIGGGVLLLAVMAILVPPAALIPVHGIIQFGSNIGRVVFMFRYINWASTWSFMAGTVVGVIAGGAVAPNLSPAVVQMGVGLFVLWSVFMKPPRWLSRIPLVTGVVSSFLTMFFGATGPFVATFTKSLALDRHRHVATHGAMMSVQHLLKTLMLSFLGFAFAPWIGFIGAMIICGALGTFLGRLILDRISDKRFRLALDITLVVLSLRLIWSGSSML